MRVCQRQRRRLWETLMRVIVSPAVYPRCLEIAELARSLCHSWATCFQTKFISLMYPVLSDFYSSFYSILVVNFDFKSQFPKCTFTVVLNMSLAVLQLQATWGQKSRRLPDQIWSKGRLAESLHIPQINRTQSLGLKWQFCIMYYC